MGYYANVIASYAGWVLCGITLERIIACAMSLCTKKNSSIVLTVTLAIICSICISTYFSLVSCITFVFNESNTHFEVKYYCCSYTAVSDQVHSWLSSLTRSLLPFITLLISNIIILVLFYQTLRNRRQMGVITDPGQLIGLTRLLIATSLTYLTLTSPTAVHLIAVPYIVHLYSSYDEYNGANVLWWTISTCLLFINNSVNFFLYCLAGTKFRDEFTSMVRSINTFLNHI